jgi:putative SOS response-associated peptidase YedK
MCGCYRLQDPNRAFAWLEVVPVAEFLPRFNIAPSQRVPVVTATAHADPMTWGIVPVWAEEKSKPLINARCETIREKRSFKSAFAQRRCLLPADGFYEWRRIDKRPHFIALHDGGPFAIAAIWEPSKDTARCCLLTTSANAILAPIHNRMPVIVRREDWAEWLSPDELADPSFGRIMTPYAPEEMTAIQVSPLVNSARIDTPRCCEPWDGNEPPSKRTVTRQPAPDGQETFGF